MATGYFWGRGFRVVEIYYGLSVLGYILAGVGSKDFALESSGKNGCGLLEWRDRLLEVRDNFLWNLLSTCHVSHGMRRDVRRLIWLCPASRDESLKAWKRVVIHLLVVEKRAVLTYNNVQRLLRKTKRNTEVLDSREKRGLMWVSGIGSSRGHWMALWEGFSVAMVYWNLVWAWWMVRVVEEAWLIVSRMGRKSPYLYVYF